MNKRWCAVTAKVYVRLENVEGEDTAWIVFGGYDYVHMPFYGGVVRMERYDNKKPHRLEIMKWLNDRGIFENRVKYDGVYYSDIIVFSVPEGYDLSEYQWFQDGHKEFDPNLANK